ncbi:MAG TPA: hypothetical protein VFV58_34830 [Blastocatellia bacterium]|jgi:hypothetical protein|nr:hypothetical protein [Blastocatellia bacterium]
MLKFSIIFFFAAYFVGMAITFVARHYAPLDLIAVSNDDETSHYELRQLGRLVARVFVKWREYRIEVERVGRVRQQTLDASLGWIQRRVFELAGETNGRINKIDSDSVREQSANR